MVVGCWLLFVGCGLLVVGCGLLVVGCGLFSCLVDCIVYTFNKTTKQQNHNITTLLSYSLSNKKLKRMISMEVFDAFLEHHFLFFLEERGAYADTLLIGTHSVERVNCDAIEHQFAS